MVKELSFRDQERDNSRIDLAKSLPIVDDYIFSEKTARILGSVYTPPNFAKLLTSWAIHNLSDKILDIGIGEGVFVFAAYRRLLELGAVAADAQHQIFGTEINASTYGKFTEAVRDTNASINFPNLYNADFFDVDFPAVDAVVGNPPYVRRTYIQNIDEIRRIVSKRNRLASDLKINRLADLYIYFLLHALPLLKPGGRLAVITSDTWLNAGYGEEFKRYLQQYFKIESLISLDKRIFDDAQVKPVLILATKRVNTEPDEHIYFIRVKESLSIDHLQQPLNILNTDTSKIITSKVKSSHLDICAPWSIHFKAPEAYEKIASHRLMTPMANIAETRIGIQTLAKEFFVLTIDKAKLAQIEPEFLEPLAQSIRYISKPTIDQNMLPSFYLFCCAKGKDLLNGTHALEHILWGETTEVAVRGKNIVVLGYHNKERIKRSGRNIWYDLKSSLERRGRAAILIPRLVYRTFTVIWNRANFVPGELFIEFLPFSNVVDVEVYLAILNSTITEVMLRTSAQIYGGGTYNIGPGRIKRVPILNPEFLTQQQQKDLKQSYLQYLSDINLSRSYIDEVVYEILEMNKLEQQKIHEVLEDLLLLATSIKEKALYPSDLEKNLLDK